MKNDVMLILSGDPLNFYFSERNSFKLTITAKNERDSAFNPELHFTKLIVNGEESIFWTETISNGHRESKWFFLPPGETTSMTWSTIGGQLFHEPGEYILQLQLRDIKSDEIKISVLND